MANTDVMLCETVPVKGHHGDVIPAYLARPVGPGPFPGIVVIHYAPGWDETIKETTRMFAAHGYSAICPNLHDRELPGGDPVEQAKIVSDAGRVPDERFVADFSGALEYLRGLPAWNGKTAVVGYCSGGRQALLAGCKFDLDAVIDCYGGRVVLEPESLHPRQPVAVFDMLADMSAPVLGLFGALDTEPSPQQVGHISAELERLGKTVDFTVYEGANHGFFSVDRPNYNVEAAKDGWRRVWEWLDRYVAN
jgi:carboxymethylenebutenolidase